MGLQIDPDDVQVCMITCNEGLLLEGTLLELKKHFDRFAIVDQRSTDDTIDIVRDVLGASANVVVEAGDYVQRVGFAGARNAVTDLCERPWALHVDADEKVVLDGPDSTIRADAADPSALFVAVERKNLSNPENLRPPADEDVVSRLPISSIERHIRLYRRDSGIRWHSFIHEELKLGGNQLPFDTPVCTLSLLHLSSLKHFEDNEMKEDLYGWMIIEGHDNPRTPEDSLSAYSLGVLNERRPYFEARAAAYRRHKGLEGQ